MNDNSSRVIEVDINEILPNRFQPRIQFDENEILELSDSIREHGVIQPIVVRTIGDKYEIIAGERRYKASVLAGKESVPVIIKNLNDKDSAEVALIENVQRKNLTPIEEALSYKKILDMGYITQENLASKLGKSQSAVANKIRLLNLSDEVQEALLENKISERHARSLLRLSTLDDQNKMLNRIISERLTVRRTDEEIDKLKNINESSDESNGDSQKIIEKGEIDMNNNINVIPNITPNPEQSSQNFDIFGVSNQQPIQSQSAMQPQPVQSAPQNFDIFSPISNVETKNNVESIAPSNQNSFLNSSQIAPMGVMQFDANGTVTNTPQPQMGQPIPEMPAQPTMPEATSTVAPQPQIAPMGGIQFDENGTVVSTPQPQMEQPISEMPVQSTIPEATSTVAPQPQIAPMGGIQFDANGTVVSTPQPQMEQPISEMPVQPAVPETSPIIENPFLNQTPTIESNATEMNQESDNLFSFGNNDITNKDLSTEEQSTTTEFKMPEPIIITDYNKQYDPIMPQTIENMQPVVDFREVINAIRECSSKIEKYGFKIDVEEYDLTNLYQVIFKIEK